MPFESNVRIRKTILDKYIIEIKRKFVRPCLFIRNPDHKYRHTYTVYYVIDGRPLHIRSEAQTTSSSNFLSTFLTILSSKETNKQTGHL